MKEIQVAIIQIIPADGWIAWLIDGDTGEPWSNPLVAWALFNTGRIAPMVTDSSGLVMELENDAHIAHQSEGRPDEWIAAEKLRRAQR